jgi:hypothetical protein
MCQLVSQLNFVGLSILISEIKELKIFKSLLAFIKSNPTLKKHKLGQVCGGAIL